MKTAREIWDSRADAARKEGFDFAEWASMNYWYMEFSSGWQWCERTTGKHFKTEQISELYNDYLDSLTVTK